MNNHLSDIVDPEALREDMVARQLVERGITDERVLSAMRRVPRELFVPPELVGHAFEDNPLPIGAGQTISQPFMVAFMIEALHLGGGEKVLEVGAGCGYAAAVLAEIAGEVFAIERIATLARMARDNLAAAGCADVYVRHGDGREGWPPEAPFDAILVSAGAPELPEALYGQLKPGGILVMPVGRSPRDQRLMRVQRSPDGKLTEEPIANVSFVPLVSGTQ